MTNFLRRSDRMTVYKLETEDYNQVVALWNKSVFNKEVLHKQLGKETFIEKFIIDTEEVKKINYIYKKDDKCIGFANGCFKMNERIGYITYVLVDKKYRRRGIGAALLKHVEKALKEQIHIKDIMIMFTNPIQLEWAVPNTKGHIHPNAPGVDVASEGYMFFKNLGYHDVVTQNTYYRELKAFTLSEEIKERGLALKAQGLNMAYYDPQRHDGLEKLFDNLNNVRWKETVMENVGREDGGLPVLVVEDKGKVCGFTGPLVVEPCKRGYFSGIGVHTQYRSDGVGRVLFSLLCHSLREQGAEYMTAFTGEKNPARYIYESAGFKIVRTWEVMKKEA